MMRVNPYYKNSEADGVVPPGHIHLSIHRWHTIAPLGSHLPTAGANPSSDFCPES